MTFLPCVGKQESCRSLTHLYLTHIWWVSLPSGNCSWSPLQSWLLHHNQTLQMHNLCFHLSANEDIWDKDRQRGKKKKDDCISLCLHITYLTNLTRFYLTLSKIHNNYEHLQFSPIMLLLAHGFYHSANKWAGNKLNAPQYFRLSYLISDNCDIWHHFQSEPKKERFDDCINQHLISQT